MMGLKQFLGKFLSDQLRPLALHGFCYCPQSLRIALFLCKIYNIILVKGVTIYRLGS
jgi:hypothetical protein